MATTELPKVLFVDDEQRILDGIRRHLHRDFDLSFAVGGSPALTEIENNGPFEVVVSDLQMPGMDGITLLGEIGKRAPETVRILLTGNADLKSAVAAVNEGNVFRFLTKPCPAEVLIQTLRAGTEQHRLLTAEKVLLEQTLHGAVRVLSEILSLSNPAAFGRATRIQHIVTALARELELEERWRFEVAAMLSQIGAVTLPPETAAKVYQRQELDESERKQVERLPEITAQILGKIPRLEEVTEMLRFQAKCFDGSGEPGETRSGEDIPIGGRLLLVAIDTDELDETGVSADEAAGTLRQRQGRYDPAVLAALEQVRVGGTQDAGELLCVEVAGLRIGMRFEQDCTALDGRLLVSRGQEVTPSLLERVRNFADNLGVNEPIHVRAAGDVESADTIG